MKQAIARIWSEGYLSSVRRLIAQPRDAPAEPVADPVAEPVAEASPPSCLRLASYNTHKCVGVDGRFDPLRIGRVVQELNADVVALQEVDQRFGDKAGLLDLARLEEETGLTPAPVVGRRKSQGWHGNIILTRGAKVRGVNQIALPGLEPRGALVADLEFAGNLRLRVVGAHFGLLRQSRRRQADLLAGFIDDHPHEAVLMGDLNEWRVDSGSPLARYAAAGVDPAYAPPSFPSRRPILPLDRIIASTSEALSDVSVHRSPLARLASDHLPVTAEWRGGGAAV